MLMMIAPAISKVNTLLKMLSFMLLSLNGLFLVLLCIHALLIVLGHLLWNNNAVHHTGYCSTFVILCEVAISQGLLESCHFGIGDFVSEIHRAVIHLKKWSAI